MKKTYIIPATHIMLTLHEMPIAASGVTGDNGIGFGGVDQSGSVEPDVKGNAFGESIFDEE